MNDQNDFDSVSLRDIFSVLAKHRWIVIPIFIAIFCSVYYFKTVHFPTFRLQQSVLFRDKGGRIIESDYLFNLKKHFFQSNWIAAEINSKIPDSSLSNTELQKRLVSKIIPFAGPSPKRPQLETGYILTLMVDADSVEFAEKVMALWVAALQEELKRQGDNTGLDFQLGLAAEPVLIRNHHTENIEAIGTSLVLAFLLSLMMIIVLEILIKHQRQRSSFLS